MSTRRPKSVLDQDRYTAELSTGQLVIGVCILLMFGLGCFLLGVLIGKFDPTLKPGDTLTASSAGDTGTQPEVKVAEVTVSPAPDSSAAAPAVTVPDPELRTPPRILNSNPESATAKPVETVEIVAPATGEAPASETAASAPPESSVATTVEAAAEKNRVAPPNTAPQAVDTPPAAAAPPKETPASEESAASWKGYGVQIIAVAKDRAEAARKALESKSSYKARVLPHARNNLYRVVVGPFADQPSAVRARDDLRSRYSYKDAFVLTLQ